MKREVERNRHGESIITSSLKQKKEEERKDREKVRRQHMVGDNESVGDKSVVES